MQVVDLDPFHKNVGDMLGAAQRCLQVRQHLPALVLMYSLIDSLAWAAAFGSKSQVRPRFESWVARWLIPELTPFAPEINATDVYAARCAVIHTLTGESDLSVSGRARRLMYAWGTAKVEVLNYAIRKSNQREQVALHYDDLLTALVRAVALFLDSANDDAALSARLELAAGKHYVNVDASGSA